MTIRVTFKGYRDAKEFDVRPQTFTVDSEHGFTALYDTSGETSFLGGWQTEDIDSINPI